MAVTASIRCVLVPWPGVDPPLRRPSTRMELPTTFSSCPNSTLACFDYDRTFLCSSEDVPSSIPSYSDEPITDLWDESPPPTARGHLMNGNGSRDTLDYPADPIFLATSPTGSDPGDDPHLGFGCGNDSGSDDGSDFARTDGDGVTMCPNCNEPKGKRGTWCRSIKCETRREALAAEKEMPNVDSQHIFKFDEPAYKGDGATVPRPITSNGPPAALMPPSSGNTMISARSTPPPQQRAPAPARIQPENARPAETPHGNTTLLTPRARFMAEIHRMQREIGNPLVKVPTVGSRELDLYILYLEVSQRGGMARVVKHMQWKAVAQKLQLPTTCTDYGYRLRRHYEHYLLAYERRHLTVAPEPTAAQGNKKKRRVS